MDPRQVTNGIQILMRVAQLARMGKWGHYDARRVARMAVCCAMTESDLWMYANPNVPESQKLYHEQQGTDHASVGLFQQQVPMWGPASWCMDIAKSTDAFVHRVLTNGDSRYHPGMLSAWKAIQKVQVSAFPDGSNYHANWNRAVDFVGQNWERVCKIVGYDNGKVI